MIKQLKDLNDAVEKMKGEATRNGQVDSTRLWAEIAGRANVKNDIANIMTAESIQVKSKARNLIIMENQANSPKKLRIGVESDIVDREVEQILVAIGQESSKTEVKATRFKEDGPMLLVCDNETVKMRILRASGGLREGSFKGVYINNDRTVAEAANEKAKREEARVKNAALTKGSGNFKYEEEIRTDSWRRNF